MLTQINAAYDRLKFSLAAGNALFANLSKGSDKPLFGDSHHVDLLGGSAFSGANVGLEGASHNSGQLLKEILASNQRQEKLLERMVELLQNGGGTFGDRNSAVNGAGMGNGDSMNKARDARGHLVQPPGKRSPQAPSMGGNGIS